VAAGAAAQTGPARVIDGDTLEVAGVRVRLWGIDAPESRQTCEADGQDYACGERATRHLRTLVADRTVSCEPRTRDRYGRTVALCRTDGSDLGAAMVRDGWALAFVRYAADYVAEELEARAARRGLWQGAFTLPWEWRRMAGRPKAGGGL
jgi:endonuclease YncB( thermonuclease family)